MQKKKLSARLRKKVDRSGSCHRSYYITPFISLLLFGEQVKILQNLKFPEPPFSPLLGLRTLSFSFQSSKPVSTSWSAVEVLIILAFPPFHMKCQRIVHSYRDTEEDEEEATRAVQEQIASYKSATRACVCGGTNHVRRLSARCPLNNKR